MASSRREEIRQYIEFNGEATLEELQRMFPDYSAMTLRRDLLKLEEFGFLKRTKGGAIALSRISAEGLYANRASENSIGKLAIARLALKFIEPARALYLDSGSTIMTLAQIFPDDYFPVLTSGANVAIELLKKPKLNVTLLGGQLNPNTLSVSGNMALHYLQTINIETAIMATSGFSLETGFTSGTFSENEVKQAIVKKAKKTVMLMDSSKLGRMMPSTFATLNDIDVLVLDEHPTDDLKKACDHAKTDLVFPRE